MNSFRTYELAILFYREISKTKAPYHLKNQLLKSSASISLNLSEGSAKTSKKDRARFYRIALGSFRESITILILNNSYTNNLYKIGDCLGAHLYQLCKSLEISLTR